MTINQAFTGIKAHKMKKQITKNDDRGTQWLINVNEVIDNPEALEFYLTKIGADFISNDDGIFASVEDCVKADEVAEKDFKS